MRTSPKLFVSPPTGVYNPKYRKLLDFRGPLKQVPRTTSKPRPSESSGVLLSPMEI